MLDKLNTLGDYVQEQLTSWNIPGVALAVIKDDQILHLAGYGRRDVERNLPVTPDTCFAIASCSKAFTAMGVALLVDEGRVSWDTPVREYLNWFRLKDDYISDHLTLRDMLSHRSGLPRHDLAWFGAPLTREELVRNLRYHELSKGFREGWQYCNLMYAAVGYITGHVAGMTWEDFIQTRIFDPLGMASACFSPTVMQQKQADYATPYRIRRAQREGETDTLERMPYYSGQSTAPAGAIHASLSDLVKWVTVHLNGGRYRDVQLVSPGSLAVMHQPQMIMPVGPIDAKLFNTTLSAYGMGWMIRPYRGCTLIEHDGNIDGFSLNIALVPQEKIGIIALTNIEGRPLSDYLKYEIVDRLLGLPNGDWHTKFHAIMAELYAGSDKDKSVSTGERIPNTSPSHPLADYAGVYAADGYPDFQVKLDGDQLYGWLAGQWQPLRHYHYDIFDLIVDRFETQIKLSFSTDSRGHVASCAGPLEPAVKDLVYRRKPAAVAIETREQLAGVYAMEVEAMQLAVALKPDNRLFAQIAGQSELELIPYQVEADCVEFTVKGVANVGFEFLREDGGTFDTLLLKQAGGVFTAKRAG